MVCHNSLAALGDQATLRIVDRLRAVGGLLSAQPSAANHRRGLCWPERALLSATRLRQRHAVADLIAATGSSHCLFRRRHRCPDDRSRSAARLDRSFAVNPVGLNLYGYDLHRCYRWCTKPVGPAAARVSDRRGLLRRQFFRRLAAGPRPRPCLCCPLHLLARQQWAVRRREIPSRPCAVRDGPDLSGTWRADDRRLSVLLELQSVL